LVLLLVCGTRTAKLERIMLKVWDALPAATRALSRHCAARNKIPRALLLPLRLLLLKISQHILKEVTHRLGSLCGPVKCFLCSFDKPSIKLPIAKQIFAAHNTH